MVGADTGSLQHVCLVYLLLFKYSTNIHHYDICRATCDLVGSEVGRESNPNFIYKDKNNHTRMIVNGFIGSVLGTHILNQSKTDYYKLH